MISGCFFGDRCSPLSSSAILVASVTETNLFDNIRNMLRTAAVPFVLTCIIYGAIGLGGANQVDAASISDVFAKEFQLNRWMILPAVIVLGLSMLRVDVKQSMTLSIVCAVILCVVFQHRSAAEIIRIMLTGYKATDPVAAQMINGGAVHRCLHGIMHLIEDHAKEADIPIRFAACKLAEGDKLILEQLNWMKMKTALGTYRKTDGAGTWTGPFSSNCGYALYVY